MKQYHVTMPNGSVWAVPVTAIARNHAAYYAQYETEGDVEKCYTEHSLPLLLSDAKELWEYAAGNMDWADVKAVAWIVRGVAPTAEADFQEGWVNGDHQVVEVTEIQEDTRHVAAASPNVDGWVSTAEALPVLAHIHSCRAGKVEVAELHHSGTWIFEQRYALNVGHDCAVKAYWRYLPGAPQ